MDRKQKLGAVFIVMLGLAAQTACTGSGSYHLEAQNQTFATQLAINTKVDLLWVVDNSASMDVAQDHLRTAFAAFAQKYMQPTWDIRAAVITTDTYLANPAFTTYLNTTVPNSVGFRSPYIYSRLNTWVNPSWNPNLVDPSTGVFANGLQYKDNVPAWGMQYSRLLPGIHDGPIAALCWEGMPYFLGGWSQCQIRDDQANYDGPSHCLNPQGSETGVTQCVNTVENDTVHSGTAIISTMPPAGTPANDAWTQQLVDDFMINVGTGSAGSGSERGIGSVIQLLNDNENTDTAFFRPGSTRGIIFVSDEDDQTQTLPGTPPNGYQPFYSYACDQAGLLASNPTEQSNVSGHGGYCCSDGSCAFGEFGLSCQPKTVDGYTYTIGICPVEGTLADVNSLKGQIDSFFLKLDGNTGVAGANPNYFVASIVALTGQSIQTLAANRTQDDSMAAAYGALHIIAVDRGDRYLALGTAVGNGSLALDISDSDYSSILDEIGQSIIQREGTFTLARAPASDESVVVTIIHANGTTTTLAASLYSVSGNILTITDLNTILSFQSTDQIGISYEPSTVFASSNS